MTLLFLAATPGAAATGAAVSWGAGYELALETESAPGMPNVGVGALSGAGATTSFLLGLNWVWTVSIHAPILASHDAASAGFGHALSQWQGPTGCAEDAQLAVGDGAATLLDLYQWAELAVESQEPLPTPEACAGVAIERVTYKVTQPGMETSDAALWPEGSGGGSGNGILNGNLLDTGDIHIEGQCEEEFHDVPWSVRKNYYTHRRTAEAVLNTHLMQAHIAAAGLVGEGSGKCTKQHHTAMTVTAAGTFLLVLPVTGSMTIITDGIEIEAGEFVGASVDLQAHVSFEGKFDAAKATGAYYHLYGQGDFLGA